MTDSPQRTWQLTIAECPDGRLAVSGLPEDKAERLSLVMRLRDVLAAVTHADALPGESDGSLWVKYARASWPAWMADVTVKLVPRSEPPA